MSINKVKYIIMGHTRKRVLTKKFINKLMLKIIKISLKSNNKTTFNLIKNLKSQYYTQQIDV